MLDFTECHFPQCNVYISDTANKNSFCSLDYYIKENNRLTMFQVLHIKIVNHRIRKVAVFLKRIYDINQIQFSNYIGNIFGIHVFQFLK